MNEKDEKPERLLREREYNPRGTERDDWRRVGRTYLGKFTGRAEVHFNEGEPLMVRKVEVVKTDE